MRLDHIVIHVDPDTQRLQSLRDTLAAIGYPFDPNSGKGNSEYKVSNINIGTEYIEVVRMFKPNVQTWMPLWARNYDNGERGTFCIFLEVPDVERTAVALKKAGIRMRGPAALSYPSLFGLMRSEAPYIIYYLPNFSDSVLQLALMQYKGNGKDTVQSGLYPNANINGINGIRRIEIELPNLAESVDMLQKVFPDIHMEGDEWVAPLEKQRISFCQSPQRLTRVRIFTFTSQRSNAGKSFTINDLEVRTLGG